MSHMIEDNLAQYEERNGYKVEGNRGHHHLKCSERADTYTLTGQ